MSTPSLERSSQDSKGHDFRKQTRIWKLSRVLKRSEFERSRVCVDFDAFRAFLVKLDRNQQSVHRWLKIGKSASNLSIYVRETKRVSSLQFRASIWVCSFSIVFCCSFFFFFFCFCFEYIYSFLSPCFLSPCLFRVILSLPLRAALSSPSYNKTLWTLVAHDKSSHLKTKTEEKKTFFFAHLAFGSLGVFSLSACVYSTVCLLPTRATLTVFFFFFG